MCPLAFFEHPKRVFMEHNEGVEWSLFNEPPTLGIREWLMAANVTGIGWML